jgi:hypothetical protein|tara:strand:- start:638 stop:1126 length:489 start_codon:yes stop_codon:yes gene_type:complete
VVALLRDTGSTFDEIGSMLGRSSESTRCRYNRLRKIGSIKSGDKLGHLVRFLNGARVRQNKEWKWELEGNIASIPFGVNDLVDLHNATVFLLTRQIADQAAKIDELRHDVSKYSSIISEQATFIDNVETELTHRNARLDEIEEQSKQLVGMVQELFDGVIAS